MIPLPTCIDGACARCGWRLAGSCFFVFYWCLLLVCCCLLVGCCKLCDYSCLLLAYSLLTSRENISAVCCELLVVCYFLLVVACFSCFSLFVVCSLPCALWCYTPFLNKTAFRFLHQFSSLSVINGCPFSNHWISNHTHGWLKMTGSRVPMGLGYKVLQDSSWDPTFGPMTAMPPRAWSSGHLDKAFGCLNHLGKRELSPCFYQVIRGSSSQTCKCKVALHLSLSML